MLQLWNRFRSSLRPSFGSNGHGRDLQSTFALLTNVIKMLVVLTAIWAVAAGFLQTGRLIQYIPDGLPGHGKGFWAMHAGWLGPLLGVPVYALKSFGVTMLLGLASAMAGGLLGFLFGVPRVATGAAAPPTSPLPAAGPRLATAPTPSSAAASAPAVAVAGSVIPGSPPPAAAAPMVRSRAWESSTNLTEISDWLTKIIVGIGLVEAKDIYVRLSQLSQSLGAMLFDGAIGSQLVLPSIIIVGALVGFLYAYLFTQLVIAGLVARADAELGGGPAAGVQTIVPRAVQDRKEALSTYIQELVAQNDSTTLDRIAQALSVAIDPDLRTKRSNILGAVATRVNLADAAGAENAMDELSSLLHNITGRDF
jgi:hypothetical protein